MRRALGFGLVAWLAWSCGSTTFSCAGMSPLPGGVFRHERAPDPLQARLSAAGFAQLNTEYARVLELIAPGQTLTVPVSCSVQSTLLGSLLIADQGGPGCMAESCGLMDGQCTAADVPVQVPVTFTNLKLQPSAPSTVSATVEVEFSTGKLFVDSVDRSHPVCILSGSIPLKCGVDFATARATPSSNTVIARLALTVDTAFSRRISVRLSQVDGLKACGTPGALPSPSCTDSNDLLITPETGGCCPGSSFDPVKDLLLTFLAEELRQRLQTAVEDAMCEPCTAGGCPIEEDGGTPSTCDPARKLCWSTALDRCAPRRAGIEGRLDPLAALSGGSSGAELDLSLMLGERVTADQGLNLGSRGGAEAVATADCVPALPRPTFAPSSLVAFDAQADGGYHVAFSVARGFLDRAGFALHQSGGLCVEVDRSSFSQLDTGLLRPLLPSLGLLLGPQDTPMRLALRPRRPPTFTINRGAGEPLLSMVAKDFSIEFYAEVDDRQLRLFTATVDLTLPFSLESGGCGSVVPSLGNLDNAVANVRFSDSELLAEDPQTLAPLIPTVIAQAEPALAGALGALDLPQVGPFGLQLAEVKGVNPRGDGTFDHAAFYATLVPAGACVAP